MFARDGPSGEHDRMRQPFRLDFAGSTARTLLASLFALAALFALGCGRKAETPPAPEPSAPNTSGTETFKVALVMSGPTSDNGWNASAYKALQAVQTELNLPKDNVAYVENAKTAGQQEENLRAYASKGYNIVFAHGSEYEDIALKLEKDFPKTLFVVSSGRKVSAHVTPVVLQLEDGAYLLGMLAAGMSKTNKVGSVGAMETVPVKSILGAFGAGATATKPGITVQPPVYTQSWDDPTAAKQAALAVINNGADVIMQDFDSAAAGVFNAVQENKSKGVYALGANSDQNAAAPDVILASAPIYQDKVFVNIAKQVKAGTFKPNDAPYGMKDGYIDFVLNPKLESVIPPALKTKLDETKKKIQSGSFVVPKGS